MQCGFLDHLIKKSLNCFLYISFFISIFCLNILCFSSTAFTQEKNQHKQFVHKKSIRKKSHPVSHKKKKVHIQENSQTQSVNNNEGGGTAAAGTAVGVATASAAAIPAASSIPSQEPEKGSVTGLPIPHFLSLRADVVNMRAGPGTRYPIIMIYHRRHMPVKILREFDVWRLIEDVDGQKGWIQQAILSRERFFITTGMPLSVMDDKDKLQDETKEKSEVKSTDSYISEYVSKPQNSQLSGQGVIVRTVPQESADPVAILKPGVVGSIKECQPNASWCKVKINTYIGWIPRSNIWGLLPQEIIQPH